MGKSYKRGCDVYRRNLHKLVGDQIRLQKLRARVAERVGQIDKATLKRALKYCDELLTALAVVGQVQGPIDGNVVKNTREEKARAAGLKEGYRFALTASRERVRARIAATEKYTDEQKAALVIGERAARNRFARRERRAERRAHRNGDSREA